MTSMIDVRVYEYATAVDSTREMTMEILLEIASQFAESRFDSLGKLYPIWHAITRCLRTKGQDCANKRHRQLIR